MAYPVLGRAEDALENHETADFLARRLGEGLLGTVDEYGTFTVDVAPEAWVQTVELCRDEGLLAYDMFDCLFGVDAGEAGFDVVVVLYSTSRGRRILVRTRPGGGREAPELPTITQLFPGANWMERETWDMFGIEFPGHPGLAPRLLCVENFEGWPLRKDFYLTSRVAKPWPGVKEPAETDEEGNVIVRVPGPGEAPGPSVLDELMASQARAANPSPPAGADPDAPEVETAESAAHTEAPPEREEVRLDQETFDRLIAEGKSERIARSKAKAAYVKKQRAAGGETAAADEAGTDTTEHDEPTTTQVEEAAEWESEPGTEGKPGPSGADEAEAELEDVEEEASVRAEQQRKEQAEARAQKAAEQAESGPVAAEEADDAPTVPEGTPPDGEDGEDQQ